jgi:hypothetical protein
MNQEQKNWSNLPSSNQLTELLVKAGAQGVVDCCEAAEDRSKMVDSEETNGWGWGWDGIGGMGGSACRTGPGDSGSILIAIQPFTRRSRGTRYSKVCSNWYGRTPNGMVSLRED